MAQDEVCAEAKQGGGISLLPATSFSSTQSRALLAGFVFLLLSPTHHSVPQRQQPVISS